MTNAKTIVFGNQKGGVGKSTIITLFANYLVLEKKEDILFLDMDNQLTSYKRYLEDKETHEKTLFDKVVSLLSDYKPILNDPLIKEYQKEDSLNRLYEILEVNAKKDEVLQLIFNHISNESWDNKKLYDVNILDPTDFTKAFQMILNTETIALYDTPGNLTEITLSEVMKKAEILIIPFDYDRSTMQSTLEYLEIFRALNDTAIIYFLPNRIKQGVVYPQKKEIEKFLTKFGTVLPPIKDKITYKRINVLEFPKENDIKNELYPIFEEILK